MRQLALALLLGAAVGSAHAAALVQVGQDPNGHPVTGGPGGVPAARPNPDPQPAANAPPQQTRPPPRPGETSKSAP